MKEGDIQMKLITKLNFNANFNQNLPYSTITCYMNNNPLICLYGRIGSNLPNQFKRSYTGKYYLYSFCINILGYGIYISYCK